MYKMIIIDDESLIRTGLRNIIEWEVYGIEIVSEADDGAKAYQIIKTIEPDIAIVDINMPNISGLELIELCTHLTKCPKFIILSGYNDFEYVRTAMKYGASNYLLKPVNQEELIITIISVVRLLDDVFLKDQQFQESISILRNDILLRILNNRIDNKELREKCQFFNLSFHCSNMHIGILKPVSRQKDLSSDQISFSLAVSCEKLCERTCSTYAAINENNSLVLIFKDYSNELQEEDYNELLELCATRLKNQTGLPIITALSQKAAGTSELSSRYMQSLHTLEHQMIMHQLFPDGTPAPLDERFIPDFDYARLAQAVEALDIDTIKILIHEYSDSILRQHLSLNNGSFKYQLVEFIICTMQELKSSLLSEADISTYKKEAFCIIEASESFVQAEAELISFFRNLTDQLRENINPAYSPLVQNVLTYVKDNYQECNLSLKTLSSHFDVNAAYLGRQFKLETNEYFSDYLNRIRIARAVHLLKTTDMKITTVASSVGFSNISYFFTIFKKITGGRPGDYKKNT